jgi:hypothetical protein
MCDIRLTVRNLLHGTVVADVNVESIQRRSVLAIDLVYDRYGKEEW